MYMQVAPLEVRWWAEKTPTEKTTDMKRNRRIAIFIKVP
jgi:hypothetical protein